MCMYMRACGVRVSAWVHACMGACVCVCAAAAAALIT